MESAGGDAHAVHAGAAWPARAAPVRGVAALPDRGRPALRSLYHPDALAGHRPSALSRRFQLKCSSARSVLRREYPLERDAIVERQERHAILVRLPATGAADG